MSNQKTTMFFGVGTGRCGTMSLANLISCESNSLCLHEGFQLQREKQKKRWLPSMVLQNRVGYDNPSERLSILTQSRGEIKRLQQTLGVSVLGDISYSYAPFTEVIPSLFPEALLIVVFRNGKDFVRSVYTRDVPDPLPVGWLDEGRRMSTTERFVELGRLKPSNDVITTEEWDSWSPVERNAWLWAETNRLILSGLSAWPESRVLKIYFEDFFSNPFIAYDQLRHFLKLDGETPREARDFLCKPINQRSRTSYVLPKKEKWSTQQNRDFTRVAGDIMSLLGYT